jgi:gamma-glutamyl phosphate reductase
LPLSYCPRAHRPSDLAAQKREAILRKIADDLEGNESLILERNMRDVAAAERKKIDATLLQRLRLKPAKVKTLVQGIRAIADMDEPLRKVCPPHHPRGTSCRSS